MHVAELNVGRLRAPIGDPAVAEFIDALEAINALADRAPGFVWRLQTDDGDATGVRAYDDESIIVNLSVWESLAALKDYVFRTDHAPFLRRRREWFLPFDGPHLVLWWVPPGHIPTVEEAVARLQRLATEGPGPEAFTFATAVEPAAP